MSVQRFLDEAVGNIITARRRAELHHYSKEVIYNMEVLVRACSRVKDQVLKENYVKEKERKTKISKDTKEFLEQTLRYCGIQKEKKTAHKKSKSRKRKKSRTCKAAA